MNKDLRFLYATAEAHPTWRADVKTLFGKYLPQFGVQTDLLALQEGPTAMPWGGGDAFLQVTSTRVGQTMADLWLQLTLFRRAFKGYDGIVVRDKPILGLFGYLAARLAGIPFFYWMSFPLPEAFLMVAREGAERISNARRLHLWLRGQLGYVILYRCLMHRADWVFAQSDYMIDELRTMGLKHSRISAIPMGVDVDSLPAKPELIPDPLQGREIAIYMGTTDRIRKPEILVDIATIVGKTIPNFTMLIIGDSDEPSDRGWLKTYARERGALEWVHFTGRIAQHEAMALARLAKVGLSPMAPSQLTKTTSPTKPIEYLALGLPIICNDLPDQAKIIASSDSGWCVDFDAEQFAAAVIECLREPERAREMAARGRAWVQANRTYRAIGQNVANTFREITAVAGKDTHS